MPVYTPPTEPGTPCPDFLQPAVDGKTYSLADFQSSPVLVVMFICNHCPYVQAVEERILALAQSYPVSQAQFLAVVSNDAENYPEDSFAKTRENWQKKNFSFPYLYDESQQMARDFGAFCTPDFFVFDRERKLAYRGRLDDSWKDAQNVKKQELRHAIDALIAGQLPNTEQNPAMGCSIKWRKS